MASNLQSGHAAIHLETPALLSTVFYVCAVYRVNSIPFTGEEIRLK